jgi:low temperature requirement protein LtrA
LIAPENPYSNSRVTANKQPKVWWGPPKKFSTEFKERKISWQELFYDLVYVIAISKITFYLSEHFNFNGLLDYTYFFGMIFWGWLNGSMYHDLHGTEGLRTRLMTLWQILIVAALVITIESNPEHLAFNATIALLVMQFYITYLWWSVGIYDKHHRKPNMPYTIIYLVSFAFMFATLFLHQPYTRIFFYISLVLNYVPPFISNILLKRESLELNLSPSMSERLGLFTIILFGEVVLGVVNGIIKLHELNFEIWINFSLTVFIVFALYWLFFTLISDRKCKPGFIRATFLELLFVPTLMALGLMSVVFAGLFQNKISADADCFDLQRTFSFSIGLFLAGICLMLILLEALRFTKAFQKRIQNIMWSGVFVFMLLAFVNPQMRLCWNLLLILCFLVVLISILNMSYYRMVAMNEKKED